VGQLGTASNRFRTASGISWDLGRTASLPNRYIGGWEAVQSLEAGLSSDEASGSGAWEAEL